MSLETFAFQQDHTFENRRMIACKILKQYPTHIPIILEKLKTSSITGTGKNKYLAPRNASVAQVLFNIRKHIPQLQEFEALFLFANNTTLVCNSESIEQLYIKHSHVDGFLYLSYSEENVFG